jgi:hypothetical protein
MGDVSQSDELATGWRLKFGIALFGVSIGLPLLVIPVLAAIGLSAGTVATVSGALIVGSEILGIVAVAVMGKTGYTFIKNRVFGFLKQYGPPAEVGRARYNIGLVMFAMPLIFGWLAPYVVDWVPGYPGNELYFAIFGDVLLLVSLFVLGGDFWDKLRGMFIQGAKTVFPKLPAR